MKITLSIAAAALACLGTPAAFAQLNGDLATWTCSGTCGASAADGDITLSGAFGNSQYGYVTTTGSSELGLSPVNLSEVRSGNLESEQNGSRMVSAAFNASAGQTLSTWFNYVSTDGKSFDDYAWARLVNSNGSTAAWLFTARSTNSNKQSIVPGGVVGNKDFDPDVTIANYASFDFNTRNTKINNPINWSQLGAWNGTCWLDKADGCGFTGWLNSQYTFAADGSYRLEVGVVNFRDNLFDSGLAFDVAGLSAAVPVPEPGTWALMLGGAALLAARRRRQD